MSELLNSDSFTNFCLDYIGVKIVAVHLVQYVEPNGNVEDDDYQLEFLCENNDVLRLATASDGERVAIYRELWKDSFTEPLSEENRKYIRDHGKWAVFNVSEQRPFSDIVGKTIGEMGGLINQFEVLAGVAFFFNDEIICFCVHCDEGKLFWGKNNPEMIKLGFKLKPLSSFA